jgi:hypothetical protein
MKTFFAPKEDKDIEPAAKGCGKDGLEFFSTMCKILILCWLITLPFVFAKVI